MFRHGLAGLATFLIGVQVAQAQVSSSEAMTSLLSGTTQAWQSSSQEGISRDQWSLSEAEGDPRFTASLAEVSASGVVVDWEISPGHYLYDDKFSITWGGDEGPPASWGTSEPIAHHDAFFGDVEIHRQWVSLAAPFSGVSERPLSMDIKYQGCSDDGVCYPPAEVSLSLDGVPVTAESPRFNEMAHRVDASFEGDNHWSERQLWWLMGMYLLLGLGLSLTPCVLPMLPVVSAMVMGSEQRARRGLMLTTMYVMGMVTVYAGMGAMVASLGAGSSFQAMMRHPLVVGLFAGMIVMAGLFTMGVLSLRSGGLSQRVATWQGKIPHGNPFGAYLLGALATLIMSPCVTGPLAGILLYIATTGDLWRGTLSLASLGLGMGLPLIAIGAFGRKIMPRPGAWMDGVKRLMGWVLIGVAVWLVGEIMPETWRLALVTVAVVIALVDGWRWQRQQGLVPHWVKLIVVGVALGLWAMVAYRASQAPPFDYPRYDDFAEIQEVMADHEGESQVNFTADWCMICEAVERDVFQNEALMVEYDGQVLFYDISDMTAEQRNVMKAHNIFGPPALVRYQDGEVIGQHLGGLDAEGFRDWMR